MAKSVSAAGPVPGRLSLSNLGGSVISIVMGMLAVLLAAVVIAGGLGMFQSAQGPVGRVPFLGQFVNRGSGAFGGGSAQIPGWEGV